jgi:hypothetical protein
MVLVIMAVVVVAVVPIMESLVVVQQIKVSQAVMLVLKAVAVAVRALSV